MIRRLTIRTPGSTTNLGPGFDVLGLGLGVYSTFTFDVLKTDDKTVPLVRLLGEKAQALSSDENNLVYKLFRQNFRGSNELLSRIRLSIETDIPLARGLGSSSTAVVAALWAAHCLGGNRNPNKHSILVEAAKIEGHPDNVAACLFGGFVIAGYSKGRQALTQHLKWPEKWRCLVVVPPYELATEEARKILPRRINMPTAVSNLQRLGLLIASVANADDNGLREALVDELHEPFRSHLVPELESLRKDLARLPILGCVLSGAGSSCLVLVNEKHKAEVKTRLQTWAQQRAQTPTILDLVVDSEGLEAVLDLEEHCE